MRDYCPYFSFFSFGLTRNGRLIVPNPELSGPGYIGYLLLDAVVEDPTNCYIRSSKLRLVSAETLQELLGLCGIGRASSVVDGKSMSGVCIWHAARLPC